MKQTFLKDYQLEAVKKMKNGCILCGGVGSGKSRTSLSYYYLQNGGDLNFLIEGDYVPMDDPPLDLYIITTAMKRNSKEWEAELIPFLMSTKPEDNLYFQQKIVIDSWNNIKKYKEVENAFFIFDEQRVVGTGAWVDAFLKISKKNKWILLSATPGDKMEDYMPVFIANGFYKNKTEFKREHIVYKYYGNYPQVDRYLNVTRFNRLRNSILIDMKFDRPTVSHHEDIFVSYDSMTYKNISKTKWNPFENKPIETASELCYLWRKVVNQDISRQYMLLELLKKHPKSIIFYNFDYELDILKTICSGMTIGEWNGHRHQPVPNGDSWVYLVQYTAGAEGWNCIRTDTIIFYSQNYSYKIMVQASGRIDRMNTPYRDLYFYHLKTRAPIDLAISRSLKSKKKFNESRFANSTDTLFPRE